MSVLVLLAVSALSTFVFGLPEATVVLYVQKLGWGIAPVAALCALGQCITFGALYFGGEQLLLRWRWLGTQVAKMRVRFASHLEERFLVLALFSATIGIPPAIGIAALGPGFQIPLRHLLPVLWLGRFSRFTVIVLFGKQLAAWWAHFSI